MSEPSIGLIIAVGAGESKAVQSVSTRKQHSPQLAEQTQKYSHLPRGQASGIPRLSIGSFTLSGFRGGAWCRVSRVRCQPMQQMHNEWGRCRCCGIKQRSSLVGLAHDLERPCSAALLWPLRKIGIVSGASVQPRLHPARFGGEAPGCCAGKMALATTFWWQSENKETASTLQSWATPNTSSPVVQREAARASWTSQAPLCMQRSLWQAPQVAGACCVQKHPVRNVPLPVVLKLDTCTVCVRALPSPTRRCSWQFIEGLA